MRELLKALELKHADLLVWERLLRNSDTNHPRNAHRLQQVRDQIKTLQIQMDMIDVLWSVERENRKKGDQEHATEQNESV
ncbi:hypothetical protein EDM57_19695 [Brevibacillus gelatini]|uniref:Uncharacterized protein n=1 Tax=Brevibacillus gelatini TaxID=1655277 RepID=A0A3M8AQU0_9BACL|nr:hypothetical protein [Brevibacillus gelatini]RNB53520.1 hypothetical protein EDM57_19695 [Brevibacillus gelatini]